MLEKAFTLSELAELTQATLFGNPCHAITGVADLASAGEKDASFLSKPKYTTARYDEAMRKSHAGVVLISPDTPYDKNRNVLIVEDPSRAFQLVIEAFFEEKKSRSGFLGVHPTAIIHETAVIGPNATIGPYAVIDQGAQIGANTVIGAGCYVGPYTLIGADCFVYPHVTIRERCQIGNRVILQPGAIIGSCGFGYTTDAKGQHTKLNQIGTVFIEDDVEIGANVTVDRARFKETRIGKGSKIDNAVQIAHGVTIGDHCLIVAQTGIAGSTKLGNHVVIGGQAAVGGHLEITSGAIIAAKSGVTKSVKNPGKYGGFPVVSLAEYNRQAVQVRNIGKYVERIEELEQRLEKLEKKGFDN